MFRHELPIPEPVAHDKHACEILRIWFTPDYRLAVSARVEIQSDPAGFGIALSDVINQFCSMEGRPSSFKDELIDQLKRLVPDIADEF